MIAEPRNAASETVFAVGDKVYLRGARFGLPGTVLRIERGKVVILWSDIDYLARHRPNTLELVEGVSSGE
ncbi:MAG: hypothetical protein WB524_24625 [Acidobacteriaceae bacterium]